MAHKYVVVDLDDEKIADLADVLGNKTCKKILEYLADNEASETEISRDLRLPANTVNYNVKKLVNSGFVEKSKNFFWSVKGKKILQYKLSNKKVVISPRRSNNAKGILGAFLATAVGALLIKVYTSRLNLANRTNEHIPQSGIDILETSSGAAKSFIDATSTAYIPELGLIFLAGGIFALIMFMIINYRRL